MFQVVVVDYPETKGATLVSAYLQQGWEPFGVVVSGNEHILHGPHERLWLRRQTE